MILYTTGSIAGVVGELVFGPPSILRGYANINEVIDSNLGGDGNGYIPGTLVGLFKVGHIDCMVGKVVGRVPGDMAARE